LLVLLAAVGVWESRLSLVAGFLTLMALVSRAVPAAPPQQKRWAWLLVGVSLTLSMAGFVRFVIAEAIPGVIAGGRAAAEKHAVAYLRTIVAAEDYMRRSAHKDHDQDHIGSAGSLAELAGRLPLGGSSGLAQSPIYLTNDQWLPQSGFIASGAYIYRVCLPALGGGWIDPGSADPSALVDQERAEREYLVYGWPRTWSPGSPTAVYVSDAYEAIRIMNEPAPISGSTRYAGENASAPCDLAAIDTQFKPWNNKAPRASLPGDLP
jgi:hypothetical protein